MIILTGNAEAHKWQARRFGLCFATLDSSVALLHKEATIAFAASRRLALRPFKKDEKMRWLSPSVQDGLRGSLVVDLSHDRAEPDANPDQ